MTLCHSTCLPMLLLPCVLQPCLHVDTDNLVPDMQTLVQCACTHLQFVCTTDVLDSDLVRNGELVRIGCISMMSTLVSGVCAQQSVPMRLSIVSFHGSATARSSAGMYLHKLCRCKLTVCKAASHVQSDHRCNPSLCCSVSSPLC